MVSAQRRCRSVELTRNPENGEDKMGPLLELAVPPIVKGLAKAATAIVAVTVLQTVTNHVTEKAMRAFESDEGEGDEEEN